MGIVGTVLSAMEACIEDPIVQTYGLGVLRNLSFLKENRAHVANSGMQEAFQTNMAPFPFIFACFESEMTVCALLRHGSSPH